MLEVAREMRIVNSIASLCEHVWFEMVVMQTLLILFFARVLQCLSLVVCLVLPLHDAILGKSSHVIIAYQLSTLGAITVIPPLSCNASFNV